MFVDSVEISLKSYSGDRHFDTRSHTVFDTFSRDFLEEKGCGIS